VAGNLYKFTALVTFGMITSTREGWLERRTTAAAAKIALDQLSAEWTEGQPTAVELRVELKPKER